MSLDLAFVRSQFPALAQSDGSGQSFFENAGGSFACRQTIDALTTYYTETKVQPYASYASSRHAGEAMDRSRHRWAEALGVEVDEVVFGPSTSMNTYVLANAFGELLGPGDEVVVTNQDHEANTGAVRRMAERVGARLVEWRIDPATGLLDVDELGSLLGPNTRLVTVPHASNIVGQENDSARICALAHDAGARVIVDAVSFAPHTLADVAALDADVYLFSLYKTYSVHQGLMVVRNGLLDELPNQSHFFNAAINDKRLNPAGPDHAQVAAAGAVLDYVEVLDAHHLPADVDRGGLRAAAGRVSALWRDHEDAVTAPLLAALAGHDSVRVLGPTGLGLVPGHRCPTIAFAPRTATPTEVAEALVARGVQTSAGHFYAYRVLAGLDLDPERGVVRLSAVHYTAPSDVERAVTAIDEVLA
ncbi:MAG: aminotransferase class V-fold PLP-dependent enzyme [Ilumatobacteraceae bacterium]